MQPEPGVNGITDAIRGQITQKNDETIEPPKNIIQTVSAARNVYYAMRQEHIKRIALYAKIEGLIAGNPPYDPKELEQAGLSHIANFNDLQARSWYERSANARWNLVNQSETFATWNIEGNDPELKRFAQIISRHFDTVVRQWKSFTTTMGTHLGQLDKFGLSPVVWSDERDWRWRVIELSRFFVPDQAQSDIEQLSSVAVESIYNVQDLFAIYNEWKDAGKEDSPWDVEELGRLLLYFGNTAYKTNVDMFTDVMEMQRHYQNGDLALQSIFSDGIRLVSLFYQEYDLKVSHYMFHRVWDTGKLLFFVNRQYEKMCEAIHIFTSSPGEFTLHSNRGIGHKIFSASQAIMQLNCNLVDAARIAGTPLVKGNPVSGKEFEQVKLFPGVPTNIGAAEFVENRLGDNIEKIMRVSQFMTQMIQFNIANSGDDPGVPDAAAKGSISGDQAKMGAFREFGILKQNISHTYNQLDFLVETAGYRMLQSKKGWAGYEFAEEWIRRCVADGVPELIFKEARTNKKKYLNRMGLLSVKATRVAGDGSQLARILSLEQAGAIAGMFGAKELKALKREWIMATFGPDFLPVFDQDSDDVDETSGGASLAAVENNSMLMGLSPIFSLDNEHRSHTSVHLALAADTMQRTLQQQMDLVKADEVFQSLIPHIASHIQTLARNPYAKDFVEKIKKPWKQIQDFAILNRKNAFAQRQKQMEQQQQDQQKTQQVLTDEQRKDIQVQGEEKRKDFKVQSTVQRAKEASDTRAAIGHEKVQKDAENQRLKIHLEADAKSGQNTGGGEAGDQGIDTFGSTPSPYDFEQTSEIPAGPGVPTKKKSEKPKKGKK